MVGSTPEVSADAVKQELKEQYRESMRPKWTLLGITVMAVLVIFGLDSIRKEFKNFHDKPYTPAAIREAVAGHPEVAGQPELLVAVEKLERAAKDIPGEPERYATVDEARNALFSKTRETER